MTADVALIERLRTADSVLEALRQLSLASVMLNTLAPGDPQRLHWEKVAAVSLKLADAAGSRLLTLGAAPAVPATAH